MVGIYFSGTGNTKHCIEHFVNEIDCAASCVSIEAANVVSELQKNDFIIVAYPIYYSNLPKIMRDFIEKNHTLFQGKKLFIIATMGLFSGDGAGCSARLLAKQGAHIAGGLHLKMPDCIGDEKVLKKTIEQNKALVKAAQTKINAAAQRFKANAPTQEGLGFLAHLAGLLGQRLWFYHKTKKYSDQLKINSKKCVGCGLCVSLCPLDNLKLAEQQAQTSGRCTLCYRCVSHCPQQAITLLGKTLYEQCKIENYI